MIEGFARSRLGFGVSGPHGLPILNRARTADLLARAHAAGIRVFDTAPSYGHGEAERRLGRALDAHPDIVPVTKVGLVSARGRRKRVEVAPDGVEASLRASAERLGVEHLPWVLLHGSAFADFPRRTGARLGELQRAGLVGRIGWTARGEALARLPSLPEVAVIAAPVSDLDAAASHGVPLIGLEALRAALPARPLPTSIGRAYRAARSLRAGRSDAPRTSVRKALTRALSDPRLMGVMVTTTSPGHLDELVAIERSVPRLNPADPHPS